MFKSESKPILLDFESNKIIVVGSNFSTTGYNELDVKIPISIGSKLVRVC